MSSLFACSRCYSRHPFEELSAGQQLCKACRSSYPIVKCTYCRTEFQQTSKTTSSVCKKCEANVKQYGKPSACTYCNIIAAFIGSKCQRCTNSEKKYGSPVNCEQCKMQCAFDRGEEKIDDKILCWLCTLSYKRALAKSKSSPTNSKQHHSKKRKIVIDKRPLRPDVTKINQEDDQRKEVKKEIEHVNQDHVGALTQLRETIAGLNRQVSLKDKELLAKDRQITELKAHHFTTETELRNKLKEAQRDYEAKVQSMTIKLKTMQKELAAKSKLNAKNNSNKKSSLTIVSAKDDVKMEADRFDGSGSD